MWGNNLTLKFPSLVLHDFIALILHDQAVTTSHITFVLYIFAGWQTIAHLDWSTPNACSTSFLHAYCRFTNLLFFSFLG
jgi:hypothetical protein